MTASGFHPGELAVQRRAAVQGAAQRLSGMLAPPNLDGGIGKFLAERDFAVVTGRDNLGRLWTSPLHGSPGFLASHSTKLDVGAWFADGDPLAGMTSNQQVGLLAIEFSTRRRVRVNGTLTDMGNRQFSIDVDQAFGNCPKYISQRHLTYEAPDRPGTNETHWSNALQPEHVDLIERSDTFFLGTTHPDRGSDASHRGGTPGFVRVDGDGLWWPDYPGNNMFNSFGNIAVDASTSLLFLDFITGATLHMSGTATLEWVERGSVGDDGDTGRRVRFTPRHIVTGHAAHITASEAALYRHNPALS